MITGPVLLIIKYDTKTNEATLPDGTIVKLEEEIQRINRGDTYTFRHDGTIYYNNDNCLPSNFQYREWIVPPVGIRRAGTWRIISGGEHLWFSPDHYHTFYQLPIIR